jgi:hypothetical protein
MADLQALILPAVAVVLFVVSSVVAAIWVMLVRHWIRVFEQSAEAAKEATTE